MLLKNVSNPIKNCFAVLFMSSVSISFAYAEPIYCQNTDSKLNHPKLCVESLKERRVQFNEQLQTTYLVTDAPLRLIEDTQTLWLNRIQQCKSLNCLKQQLDIRFEDLNIYRSMNQTLTQHYLKFEQGQIAKQPIHIKIHQLSKDRMKIEGMAYRNPNNRLETQNIPLLAYTTPDKKHEILDNEHDCKYQLNFQKALLVVNSTQSGCERFVGIYRLYD